MVDISQDDSRGAHKGAREPSPNELQAAFSALSVPDQFASALAFLQGCVLKRAPAQMLSLLVGDRSSEQVLGILDLIDKNNLVAEQAAPAMVHLLRHDDPLIAKRAADILVNLSAGRMVAFVPVLALATRDKETQPVEVFQNARIGGDAIIIDIFAKYLDAFLRSDVANQSRMLSDASQRGWHTSDLHTVVTLGALCSDCSEHRRGALRVLKASSNANLGPENIAMLEAALAFSAADLLTTDCPVSDRNTFLFLCSTIKPSPVLGSVIMAAHERIQEQVARTNQAIKKEDHYATLTLCSAAAELLPAEHREAPLQRLMGLLQESGHHNFYGAIALTQLVGIIPGEQARRVLDAVIKFLDRELTNLPPNGTHYGIDTLASALGEVKGFDEFIYDACRSIVLKQRNRHVEATLHLIASSLVARSEDPAFVQKAGSMVRYLRGANRQDS